MHLWITNYILYIMSVCMCVLCECVHLCVCVFDCVYLCVWWLMLSPYIQRNGISFFCKFFQQTLPGTISFNSLCVLTDSILEIQAARENSDCTGYSYSSLQFEHEFLWSRNENTYLSSKTLCRNCFLPLSK